MIYHTIRHLHANCVVHSLSEAGFDPVSQRSQVLVLHSEAAAYITHAQPAPVLNTHTLARAMALAVASTLSAALIFTVLGS
jgi:hypothetical protein